MSQTSVKAYLAEAFALERTAGERKIPYVLGGMTLSGMDCQGLCEYLLIRCGIPRKECNLAGSNAHYRACVWTGTPEACRQQFGRIPAGAWLFIVRNDGREPEKYKGDGIGNASHMGVYLGAGDGALHASSSKGRVSAGTFNGTSGSGGWNRVGLCKWIDYGLDEKEPAGAVDQPAETLPSDGDGSAAGASPAVFSDWAQVSTPDGNPVKLRAKPSRKSSLYWKVPNGAGVLVEGLLEVDGTTWAQVQYGNRKGFIMSEFIIGG
ncbi:MAG: hypothetical protein J6K73_08605 [Clostridia bacterium]|nr:hypothetical protein [Clostridia bacterium]MBP3649828.1 hypothetical protein [Clostridia bacterium]